MLDISFAELLLIVVVAVIFIGPKELPVVIRAVARGLAHLRNLAQEIRSAFDDLARESGVKDIKAQLEAETRWIQGDDGTLYESYNVEKLEDMEFAALPAPSPEPVPPGTALQPADKRENPA